MYNWIINKNIQVKFNPVIIGWLFTYILVGSFGNGCLLNYSEYLYPKNVVFEKTEDKI